MNFLHRDKSEGERQMKSEYFQTLVETIALGSFSKAAEKLFVTQSAISRRIQLLEDHYGYPLIDRSGSNLVPTEAGKIVIEKALKIFQLEKELVQKLHDHEMRTRIAFCCTPAFGIAYIPDLMKRFMFLYSSTSEIKFSFEMPDDVIAGLQRGTYQAGVIEHSEPYELGEFETFSLPDDELIFVTSPLLGIDSPTVTIDQLIPYDLYIRKEGCCSSKLLIHNLKNSGRVCTEFAHTIICDDLHYIINTVCEGGGISFLSRSLVEQYIRQGTLREHRITRFNHTHHRTLVLANRPVENNPLTLFVDEIFKLFNMKSL